MIKLKRIAAGFYTATATTRITRESIAELVGVDVEITHIAGQGWTYSIRVVPSETRPSGIKLCDGDATERTFADAKEALTTVLARGWARYSAPGFSCWALAE